MKIIAIEGLDKAGKNTARELLCTFFEKKGLSIASFSLPDYGNPIGKIIHQWLKGEFQADVKTFELLQAADKQHCQMKIRELEEAGTDILIIDRYIHSLMAYGAYDNDDRWLYWISKYVRKPDAVVYMDVEPEVSMHRRGKYGDNDRYEEDLDRLRYTAREYDCIFKEQADLISVKKINANHPLLIVKAELSNMAKGLYEELLGQRSQGNDATHLLSPEENELVRSWYQVSESVV